MTTKKLGLTKLGISWGQLNSSCGWPPPLLLQWSLLLLREPLRLSILDPLLLRRSLLLRWPLLLLLLREPAALNPGLTVAAFVTVAVVGAAAALNLVAAAATGAALVESGGQELPARGRRLGCLSGRGGCRWTSQSRCGAACLPWRRCHSSRASEAVM
jgi:hypothetical protein